MAISQVDVKLLWALSAGICSRPGCGERCIKFVDRQNPYVTGEMAHIIARQQTGARGQEGVGSDSYSNLILLCPTHHTEVDKAPAGTYTVKQLQEWKRDHEAKINASLEAGKLDSLQKLAKEIQILLVENRETWKIYGPESAEALKNPLSNLADIWELRKLQSIVPNNKKINSLIESNKDLINIESYRIFCRFIEHAEGFEANCYERREGVPRFPVEFGELIDELASME